MFSLNHVLFLICLLLGATWLGLIKLSSAADIAQILSLAGLIGIFLEVQRNRKELERQKEGLSLKINRTGTVSLINKLQTSIKIVEVRQRRSFLKPSDNPANANDGNIKPEFTGDITNARVLNGMNFFQDTSGSLNKEFRKALSKKLKELRKQKRNKNFGIKVSDEFLPVPVSWGDECVFPDSLTYGLRIEESLCVFIQTWITYKTDNVRHNRYFVSWNSNLVHPTQEWNTYEKS